MARHVASLLTLVRHKCRNRIMTGMCCRWVWTLMAGLSWSVGPGREHRAVLVGQGLDESGRFCTRALSGAGAGRW